MKRRTARQKAIQVLYQVDLLHIDWNEALEHVLEEGESSSFLTDLIAGVVENQPEIDMILKPLLNKWTLERLAIIDRAILRLAVYELKYTAHTPAAVVINEAVELGKSFGSEHSGKFINGILSNALRQERSE